MVTLSVKKQSWVGAFVLTPTYAEAFAESEIMMRLLLKAGVFAAVAVLTGPAQAQNPYAVAQVSANGVLSFEFGTVSLSTGSFTSITVDPGYQNVFGLGFGSNGRLYGLSADGTPTSPVLDEYLINPATGAMTLQKTFAGTSFYGASANGSGVFTGVTNPTDTGQSTLFTLNPVTGTLVVGASTSVAADGLVVSDGLGNIYASSLNSQNNGSDGLAKIKDNGTGASSFVGSTGIGQVYTGFFSRGSLYAFGTDSSSNPGLYTLSTTTGAAKLVAAVSLSTNSVVLSAALAPVPELSTTAAMGVGLLGLGVLVLAARRRKAAARV